LAGRAGQPIYSYAPDTSALYAASPWPVSLHPSISYDALSGPGTLTLAVLFAAKCYTVVLSSTLTAALLVAAHSSTALFVAGILIPAQFSAITTSCTTVLF
jgi:hypothetical protein